MQLSNCKHTPFTRFSPQVLLANGLKWILKESLSTELTYVVMNELSSNDAFSSMCTHLQGYVNELHLLLHFQAEISVFRLFSMTFCLEQ